MDGIGYLVLAAAVFLIVTQLLKPSASVTNKNGATNKGGSAPTVDAAVIKKDSRREYDIGSWHSSWRLAEPGRGAFTFTAHKPRGGLIIGIGTHPNANWHKGTGYGIVLDNTDKEKPRSWVGKLPWFAREMTGSKVNHGYRMRDCAQDYWVVVDAGRVYVGEGSVPGQGRVIVAAHDPAPEREARYFGFGSFGTSMGWGRHVNDATDGKVTNIRLHPVPDAPPLNVTLAHCPNGQLSNKHVPVPFVTQSI